MENCNKEKTQLAHFRETLKYNSRDINQNAVGKLFWLIMYFSNQLCYFHSRKYCSLKPEGFAAEREVIVLLSKTRVFFLSTYAERNTFLPETVMDYHIILFLSPAPKKHNG